MTLLTLLLLAQPAPATAPAPRAIDVLTRAWPDHPEWAAMLVDILQGSQLGPRDGWFRKGVAQTRLTFDAARSRLDSDEDGAIERPEFPGSDDDFRRLDRDGDKSLTATDFDFNANALAPSPGTSVFYRADRDGDGKVSRAEFDALFQAADPEKLGFLSLGDLQRALNPPPKKPAPPSKSSDGPSRWTLVKGLFRQEIGSLQPGPKVGEVAPDFTLKTVDGKDSFTLSHSTGPRPTVLIFGNFTCGPFRGQAGNVEKLYRRYKDRATFVMVYVREAHPTDGWSMESNDRGGVSYRQPRSYAERVGIAQTCRRTLGLGMPMLVDTLDDAVGARYSGMPSRLYLIDAEGKVAAKSGRGPFGFKPDELEHSLLLLLGEAGK